MKIDMSPQSITMRIKKSSELRRLCIALGGNRLKEKMQNPQFRTNASIRPSPPPRSGAGG
jgi:hypothetical protein